ncbi:hypothetical protein DFH27DRAFT_140558 [Peziza echinospora]|nr:hypothetical protein DFH27DRAFT_140558 [Peziza echinospora]
MAIPVAPYPPASVRKTIPADQWATILSTYTALLQYHLSLPPADFQSTSATDTRLIAFLTAYIHELSLAPSPPTPAESALRKLSFQLIHRLLSPPDDATTPPPDQLLNGAFLLDLANAFPRSQSLRTLFSTLTTTHPTLLTTSLTTLKTSVVLPKITPPPPSQARAVSAFDITDAQALLRRISILLLLLPYAGETFLAGSDYLDALADLHERYAASRATVLRAAYSAFAGVLRVPEKQNYSLLLDTLYEWAAHANGTHKHAFLTALVCETPLLRRLRTSLEEMDPETAGAGKVKLMDGLISKLQKYTPRADGRVRRPLNRSKKDKGKGKGKSLDPSFDVDQAVAQVLEFLPTIPPAAIIDVLHEFSGDVQSVIQHFLEGGNTPAQEAQQKQWPSLPPSTTTTTTTTTTATTTTPLPKWATSRKNIHDATPLPSLATPSTLHLGKKNPSLTADTLLSPPTNSTTHTQKKLAIYAALSTILYNPDDDERDDTYDVEDVGGAIDAGEETPSSGGGVRKINAPPQPPTVTKEEEYLYALYTTDPTLFARDAETRRSKMRAESPANRARKEAHKSSRANHSRRDGRAKKMARGMAGGLP